MIRQILALRATYPELFSLGTYEPLTVTGLHAERVCAFARRIEDRQMSVVAALFPARREREPEWGDTAA